MLTLFYAWAELTFSATILYCYSKLGGFFGQAGTNSPNVLKKKAMLLAENVQFEGDSDRIAEESLHIISGVVL